MGFYIAFLPIKQDRNSVFSFLLYGKVPLVFFFIALIILIVSFVVNFNQNQIGLIGLIITPILTTLFVILINIYNSKTKNEFLIDLLVDEVGHNLLALYENGRRLEKERKDFENENDYYKRPIYPLKLDIWKYSFNTLTINPFKKFMGLYNGFVYESLRYNENVKHRSFMNPNCYPKNFSLLQQKNNKNLQEFGKETQSRLISILKTLGPLSIVTSESVKNHTDINRQLSKDGFSQKQINEELEDYHDMLKDKGEDYYLIFYCYGT
ncbi:MAG: hypothetical protein ACC609_09280 [Methanobacterium formicicum]